MNTIEFGSYAQMLCEPAYVEWKAKQFAEALGVTAQTIYNWDKKVDWETIKIERRKRFSRPTLDVDLALLKAAKSQDVQAIRTWYERFDQWTPSSKILSEHSVSDADIDKALNELIERKRAAVAALAASGLDEAGRKDAAPKDVGETATGAGRVDAVLPAESGTGKIHK